MKCLSENPRRIDPSVGVDLIFYFVVVAVVVTDRIGSYDREISSPEEACGRHLFPASA